MTSFNMVEMAIWKRWDMLMHQEKIQICLHIVSKTKTHVIEVGVCGLKLVKNEYCIPKEILRIAS